ncbi:NTP transferase domain-containing protein [Candidatus Roizmanbacteria bacterium]|nr:NTP transferase domain-containing protein [Candidatus Roizmanbacteria bacterium]
MKTIILCGGRGTRLNEETEFKPKPLVQVGGIPILLHIMNIYAHYGFNDFIVALGYKGDMIKDYFLTLSRYESDFSFNMSTGAINVLGNSTHKYNYNITFAETGPETKTSGRVLECAKYIPEKDPHFFVTYGDGVGTVDIGRVLDFHKDQEKKLGVVGTISAVHPPSRYGRLTYTNDEVVATFEEKMPILDDYINGGFQVYNRKALDYLDRNEMLEESLVRITKDKKLALYRHAGYWKSMDTMKDYMDLNSDWDNNRPWAVWEKK